MKPRCQLSFLAVLLLIATAAGAADYPSRIGFSLQHAVPRLNNLATVLSAQEGSVPITLTFAYDPAQGFSCSQDSTVDQLPAECRASQSKNGYSVTATSPTPRTQVTLKGSVAGDTARATYRGAKGRLLQRRPAVTVDFDAAPLISQVILSPVVESGGTLGGTGSILSPYGGSGAAVALSGKIRGKSVHWVLDYGADRLNFAGREKKGNWVGTLKGRIGLARISKSVKIPLSELPDPTVARFHGTVLKNEGTGPSETASGVLVTLQSDSNGDGTIGEGESAATTTNEDGNYDFSVAVTEGRSATLDFTLAGYSKTPKMFASVSLGAVIPVNTTLRQLDEMTIAGQSAATDNGALKLDSLPAGVSSMKGRVFNPLTETSQFPGEFADSSGNMLISSVFSGIEARDANNDPVTTLAQDTKVRMRVPADTWPTLRDLHSGNGRIDVPLYYYDEKDGKWKRSDSDGWLEDESAATLAESALASIKDGTRSGNLYAAGNISHLSYWNIDWPVDTHGCVHGKLLDGTAAAVGAVVTARGVTYTGSSAPRTTGADGEFCIDVMRSEGAGEDLNDNGISGELNQVALTAYYRGKYYDLGSVTIPTLPATCGTSGCVELRNLVLEPAKEVTTSACSITGQVVYSGTSDGGDPPGVAAGDPLAGAMVFAYDSNAQQAIIDCVTTGGGCEFSTTTDADGHFSIKTIVLFSAELFGYKANFAQPESEPIFFGELTTDACPAAPVTLKLDAWIPAP